jgi:hypothetical protein
MRGLIRSAVALLALGAAAIGCNKNAPEDQTVDAPFQASFRVPGMS